VPYYTLEFFIGLLVEPTALALLILMFLQKWAWVAGILIGFVGLNLGVSVFLNSRTRVEFAKIEDARQDKPGRWYPQ
jgi:hypothetical protein